MQVVLDFKFDPPGLLQVVLDAPHLTTALLPLCGLDLFEVVLDVFFPVIHKINWPVDLYLYFLADTFDSLDLLGV